MNWLLIKKLALNDIKRRYQGSYLGVVWLIMQPIISIFIFWFVFQVGFKSAAVGNHPFFLWLISGILPWFFISEALSSATTSVIEQANIVKKIAFNSMVLPIIKILNAILIHLFFIFLMIASFYMYGYRVSYQAIGIIYYILCAFFLLSGISLITSSLSVFIKDIAQVVGVMIQFGFWITPIFWNIDLVPDKYAWIIKLNPFFYIVNGYREVMLDNTQFWSSPESAFVFLMFVALLNYIGFSLFKKLKPHFPDVL